MKTKRLFREDVYMKKAAAKIIDVTTLEGKDGKAKTLIMLDQTIFFPTGGGQSCDQGTISGFPVVDVYEKEDEIYHEVEAAKTLAVGDEVTLSLDWEHRFDNMQRHCGEHILSGMFYRECGGINRGFHMGEEYMTIDISLEEPSATGEKFDKITWEMAEQVELCANEAIWANAPVITRHFDSREETENLPLRKALAFDEDITIVSVGSTENPSDCVACCGTHPSSAGQVGMIKIYKVEPNKGMFRVYFEAGRRAFTQYQTKLDVLTTIEKKFSAGTDDLLHKYDAQQDKNKAVREELYHIKKHVMEQETESLKKELESVASGNHVSTSVDNSESGSPSDTSGYRTSLDIVRYYDILSIEDLLNVGRSLIGQIPRLLFLVHKSSHTLLLFSNGQIDCGKLVKENAEIYSGKGGGNNEYARAIFPKADYIDTFMDLLDKHLR